MKIQILHASVNPDKYDVKRLGGMCFGEAREFFEDDNIGCCNWGIDEIDAEVFNARLYKPEGIMSGDISDVLFVWFKLVPWR